MWMLIAICALVLLCWNLLRRRTFWSAKNVAQTKHGYIFGDNWSHILRKKSFAEMAQDVYNKFPNSRYFGMFYFSKPIFIVKDPDLIKKITVKDFDHFVNHTSLFPEDDPFFSRNLFTQKDEIWREMRITLTPLFTSSKLRYMFSLFSQTCDQFVRHFLEKSDEVIVVEMKDIFTRFANDIIANIAFGTECNSLTDPHNLFYLMSKEATEIEGAKRSLRLFGYCMFPKLFRMLNISPFDNSVREFFFDLIKKVIEARQKNDVVRPDMVHLLLAARSKQSQSNSHKSEITDEEITSQAVAFLFAGFESVSSLMCFMAYELGVHPAIQQKLIEEVDQTAKTCVTYEAILGMKYMDMVVSESLRKWSSSIVTNRVCSKPYTIEPVQPDEKPVLLEKGTWLWIPIFSLLRDPKFFPEPESFQPERFDDENKEKIHPCVYLPFGYGPRSCIGSRFALLETKTLFFSILRHFEIVPVEKTQVPVRLARIQINLAAEKGLWFGLKRREETKTSKNLY